MSFKTNIPESITTIDGAIFFILALIRNDEAFHPDDDPHDVIWQKGCDPTDKQLHYLKKAMADCHKLEHFDVCEFMIEQLMYEEPKNTCFLFGSEAVNEYVLGGPNALDKASKHHFGIFKFEADTCPSRLIAAFDGWMKWVVITENEFNYLMEANSPASE